MSLPTGGLYPKDFDTDTNLFVAHDALRVVLVESYTPGDTSIVVDGDATTLLRFPDSGLITLTEQCSNIDDRAISFFYTSKGTTTSGLSTFEGLQILPGFTDVPKYKSITNVTQNVMAPYHNNLKDAIIAMQEFFGVKGTTDLHPLGATMEGRINFLRKLVLSPKAWFSCNKRIGIVPLEVTFKDLSFRLGTDGTAGEIIRIWDFGDNTTSVVSCISVTSHVPVGISNILVQDLDGGDVIKTYMLPGKYDVTLTVRNDFGENTLILKELINARVPAPDEAIIDIIPRVNQILTPGAPVGGPYTTTPVIRSPINTLIDIEVNTGPNPDNPGHSYAGELLDGYDVPIDPIETYTWSLGDDLPHSTNNTTRASFSIGGLYDLVLRTDTLYGSYRITQYIEAFDIVEQTNLWLWNYVGGFSPGANTARAYEYGLLSETFKSRTNTTLAFVQDSSFLNSESNSEQMIAEFKRNVGFGPRGTTPSGNSGFGLLYWATGRGSSDPVSAEEIGLASYDGFTDVYLGHTPLSRPWNWCSFASTSNAYFLFGAYSGTITPYTSPTNQTKTDLNTITMNATSATLTPGNYVGGAGELQNNVAVYNPDGSPTYGHFSIYRTCWKDNTGFIIRNDGIGPFFRLKSFYRTQGTVLNPVQSIQKLPDMPGPTKLEGQLVPLSSGVYFFNNSGSVSAYNDTTGTWAVGGPGVNSTAYRGLQDTSVPGFDDASNTLLAASDGDQRAYLSFDYSSSAFIRFNEADLTFSTLGYRPTGDQWQIAVF
jgi:PKD repeat protein